MVHSFFLKKERKKFIDGKFSSDNTIIIQIYTLLTYKDYY